MNPEYVESQIKELKAKISDKRKKGQIKIEQYQKLQKDINEGAALIQKWLNQIEALQKVLDN